MGNTSYAEDFALALQNENIPYEIQLGNHADKIVPEIAEALHKQYLNEPLTENQTHALVVADLISTVKNNPELTAVMDADVIRYFGNSKDLPNEQQYKNVKSLPKGGHAIDDVSQIAGNYQQADQFRSESKLIAMNHIADQTRDDMVKSISQGRDARMKFEQTANQTQKELRDNKIGKVVLTKEQIALSGAQPEMPNKQEQGKKVGNKL